MSILGFASAAFIVGIMYENGYDPDVEDGNMRNYDTISITEPLINVPNETKTDTKQSPGISEDKPVSKLNSEEKELTIKEVS